MEIKMENGENTGKAGTWLLRIILFGAALMTGILAGKDGHISAFCAGLSGIPEEAAVFRVLLTALSAAVLFAAGLEIQVAIHETGHLIFGLLTGYRFVSFRIGSLMLVRKNGRFCLKRYSLKGTGGQCLMAPPEPYRENMPFLLYHLGGSIANFALSAVWIAGYAATRKWPISLFFLFSALFGVIIAAMNGIPGKAGQLANDGYNAISMKKDERERWYSYLQLAVNAKLADGQRLKDMPEEWFALPKPEEMDHVMSAAAGLFAYLRALDESNYGKAEEIGQYLRQNAEGMLGLHKGMLLAEMLFLELIGKNRKEEVEGMITDELKWYLKATKKLPSTIRVLYAYDLLARNNEGSAERRRTAFEKKARSYPNECEIKGEIELMDCALTAYKNRDRWEEEEKC